MAPRVTGLPPHTPRARAQTKTFHSPRPSARSARGGGDTCPASAESRGKENEARGHSRTRTRLWPGGLGGKRGAGRRLLRAPRRCAGAVARLETLFSAERPKGGAGGWLRTRAASFPVLSFAGSLGSASVAVAPALPPPPTAARASAAAAAASLPRSLDRTSAPMQRRDDPAARMSRSSGRSGSMDPSGAHPSVRQAPSRQPPLPHRSRGGGGGSRGGARASPATQPPPLLPPSATGPDATVGGPAPTPLLPPSATASVKMEPENKYLPELMAEKDSLDPSFTHAMQLLTAGKRASRVPLGRLATRGHGQQWLCSARFPPPAPSGSRQSGTPLLSSSSWGAWIPHSHPGPRCEGEFLDCSGGPKGTWRFLSAKILMDSAALPAPLPTLPPPTSCSCPALRVFRFFQK